MKRHFLVYYRILTFVFITILTSPANTYPVSLSMVRQIVIMSNRNEGDPDTSITNETGEIVRASLPLNFADKCYAHIEELASYGLRSAGLESETKTIGYLTSKLAESGIMVTADTVKYKYFKLDSANVIYNNNKINYSILFINPYDEVYKIESEYFLLNTPLENLNVNLENKIILVSDSYKFFDLFKINAKAIILLKDSIFNKFEKPTKDSKILLNLFGNIVEYKTFNIIGNSKTSLNQKKDIIISAHWDSYKGPGADDNASGIGVMIELAKYFQQNKINIPFNIKYIAFGAEEMGMLGSQSYVQKHKNEFNNSVLNINMDMIGGKQDISIELQKFSYGDLKSFENSYASRDSNLRWILISPELYNVVLFSKTKQITWIESILKNISKGSNYKYFYSSFDGDHRMLALSGVPTVGICVYGNKYHCPEDIPAQVNKASLEKVAKLVTDLILNIKISDDINNDMTK